MLYTMHKEGNIINFLRMRELGTISSWPRGKIIVLPRPNFNEDCWFYNWDLL